MGNLSSQVVVIGHRFCFIVVGKQIRRFTKRSIDVVMAIHRVTIFVSMSGIDTLINYFFWDFSIIAISHVLCPALLLVDVQITFAVT